MRAVCRSHTVCYHFPVRADQVVLLGIEIAGLENQKFVIFTIKFHVFTFNLVETDHIYHILLWFVVFTYNWHFLPLIFTFRLYFIMIDQIYHTLLIYLWRQAFFIFNFRENHQI